MKSVTIDGIEYEALDRRGRILKALFVQPLANYLLPRFLLRRIVGASRSEMVQASLEDPGGWRSMRVAYEHGEPVDFIDRIVTKYGSFPMGLRNRKKLAVKVLGGLIDESAQPQDLIAIGAGAGNNVIESMATCKRPHVRAWCIDLNHNAFSYGKEIAEIHGVADRVKFIHGNASDVAALADCSPRLVTMIGIIEYFKDNQVVDILRAMHAVMPAGGAVIANSIENTHGVDRFLRTIFNLHIIYRNPEEIVRLMRESGFEGKVAAEEPLGIFKMVVGRKS